MNKYKAEVFINIDGTYSIVKEVSMDIDSDLKRDPYYIYHPVINKGFSEVEILEAKTILDGEEFFIEEIDIIKNTFSYGLDFDAIRDYDPLEQILINYPRTSIGSKIYLKYKYNFTKPIIIGQFIGRIYFYIANNFILDECEIQINSLIPLKIEFNDPSHSLLITRKNIQSMDIVNIKLTKKIDEDIFFPSNYKTFIDISSFYDKLDFAKHISDNVIKILDNLEDNNSYELEKIISALSLNKYSNILELINSILFILHKKISYTDHIFTKDGKIKCYNLEKMIKSSFSDAIGFCNILSNILQNIGIKSNICLIENDNLRCVSEISNFTNYMTCIIFIDKNDYLIKNNKSYEKLLDNFSIEKDLWINPSHNYNNLYEIDHEFSDKFSIVISKNPRVLKTPSYDHTKTGYIKNEEVIFENESEIKYSGNIQIFGEIERQILSFRTCFSKEEGEEKLFSDLLGSGDESDYKLNYKLLENNNNNKIFSSRIYKYDLVSTCNVIKTNLGFGKFIHAKWIKDFLPKHGIYFPITPRIIKNNIRFKNVSAVTFDNLNIKLDTQWLKAIRRCYQDGSDIVFNEIIEIPISFISEKTSKLDEFKNFQKELKRYFENVAILYCYS